MTDALTPKIWPDNALHIESMDLDAQGVAHRSDGKVVFVDGALPFEVVRANVHRKKNNCEQVLVVPTSVCMRALVEVARCNTSSPRRK